MRLDAIRRLKLWSKSSVTCSSKWVLPNTSLDLLKLKEKDQMLVGVLSIYRQLSGKRVVLIQIMSSLLTWMLILGFMRLISLKLTFIFKKKMRSILIFSLLLKSSQEITCRFLWSAVSAINSWVIFNSEIFNLHSMLLFLFPTILQATN